MERRIPWLWIGVAAALLLLPTAAGRLLLDVIGGLTLTLLLLPLLAGGVLLVGWQLLRRRLRTCPSCGFISLGTELCPACGSRLDAADAMASTSERVSESFWAAPPVKEIDARDVTITVDAVAVDGSAQGESASQPFD